MDPTGRFLYATHVEEQDPANSVAGYGIDPVTGALTAIPGSPVPTGRSPRFLAVHPSGRFLYVSNQLCPEQDSAVSAYQIDGESGALRALGRRAFATGRYPGSLVAQDRFLHVSTAAGVATYEIDPASGGLHRVGIADCCANTLLAADPAGRFLHALSTDGVVSALAVDAATGGLSLVSSTTTLTRLPCSLALSLSR